MEPEIKKNSNELDERLDRYSLLIQKKIGKLVGKILPVKHNSSSKKKNKIREKTKE